MGRYDSRACAAVRLCSPCDGAISNNSSYMRSRNTSCVNSEKSVTSQIRELALAMPNGPLPKDPAARALADILAPLDDAHRTRALHEVMDYYGVRLLPRSLSVPGIVRPRSRTRW